MEEAQAIERGEMIVRVLGLRLKANGRVDTCWGDKTPLGIFRTVQRIINEGE